MAIERLLRAVGPVLFTSNGGGNGLITVSSTKFFKVKAKVVITANSLPTLNLEIKRVISPTQMLVGPNGQIRQRTDISAYTTALLAKVEQPEQDRPGIPTEQHERAVYEEEPTLAKRVILVDEFGEFYEEDNPLPVQLSDGSINIDTLNADLEVQLTDKESAPGENDYDIVRIGNGQYELAILPDGSIKVVFAGVSTPLIQNIPIAAANTQYSVSLPASTRRFHFKNRGLGKLQVSFITGQTNTNFFTLHAGAVYSEENVSLSSTLTLFFQSSLAGQTVELLRWD